MPAPLGAVIPWGLILKIEPGTQNARESFNDTNIKSEQVILFQKILFQKISLEGKKKTEGCWDQVVESKGMGQTAKVHVVLCDL